MLEYYNFCISHQKFKKRSTLTELSTIIKVLLNEKV